MTSTKQLYSLCCHLLIYFSAKGFMYPCLAWTSFCVDQAGLELNSSPCAYLLMLWLKTRAVVKESL